MDPNPGRGSGTPCEDCGPGDEPLPPDEEPCGELGDDGCEELDPCEGDNPPDYCSESDLCLGDPLPNPEITPSNGWNVKGGMFGPTRNCDSNGLNCDFHDGIDISAELNSPLYSMHPGTVVERRYPPMNPGEYDRRVRTWGNYVIIESEINGEIIRFRYAHLNEMHVPAGTTVYAGQQLGLTGNTGNAQDNGNIVVLPHVHIQARKVVNGQESKVDPNDYMSTKFNSNGTINTTEISCD
ncbi:MAG: M23 family metallopeptidase [Balneolaceae bacterium]|nr:M23 family metallopeptidase [Balneolaceae bacterium]